MQRDLLFPELEKELKRYLRPVNQGILPSQDIQKLIERGHVVGDSPIDSGQVQPASIDLRLGSTAYRVQASFLPGDKSPVSKKINRLVMHELDLTRPAVLERGCVYIVRLIEELRLPKAISGRANPKSSTGRLDIFTRLITDYSGEFESVPKNYQGPLYVEVVPRTFSILVQRGLSLNQLRFVRGNPNSASNSKLTELDISESLVISGGKRTDASIDRGVWFSIDLRGAGKGQKIVGYKAKNHAPLLDLRKVGDHDPGEFWEPIKPSRSGQLVLNPDDFYILASKERVRIPPTYSASMVPYDPSVGEFRIHYAGFFDPGFGYGANDVNGARAVLEVRSHEVPFLLEDGQVVGRLIYERLLDKPDKIYGAGIGSSYQSQGLALSKHFRPWSGV